MATSRLIISVFLQRLTQKESIDSFVIDIIYVSQRVHLCILE